MGRRIRDLEKVMGPRCRDFEDWGWGGEVEHRRAVKRVVLRRAIGG